MEVARGERSARTGLLREFRCRWGVSLRIRNDGEVSVSNPTVEGAPAQDAADAVLDYRFIETGEHVLRLAEPVARRGRRR